MQSKSKNQVMITISMPDFHARYPATHFTECCQSRNRAISIPAMRIWYEQILLEAALLPGCPRPQKSYHDIPDQKCKNDDDSQPTFLRHATNLMKLFTYAIYRPLRIRADVPVAFSPLLICSPLWKLHPSFNLRILKFVFPTVPLKISRTCLLHRCQGFS